MAISFKGLMDYQKEIDTEKRYQEAFGLKKDAFELQKKQYELAVETLDQKRLSDSQDFYVKFLKVASAGQLGGIGGLSGTGISGSGTATNKISNTNQEAFSMINKRYPDVAPETIAKIMAISNLKGDVGDRLLKKLDLIKNNFITAGYTDETTMIQDMSRLVNNMVETENDTTKLKAWLNSNDPDFKIFPKSMREAVLSQSAFTNITFPSVTPYTEKFDFKKNRELQTAAFVDTKVIAEEEEDKLRSHINNEVKTLEDIKNGNMPERIYKDAQDNPVVDPETGQTVTKEPVFKLLRGWAEGRLAKIGEVVNKSSSSDPTRLLKFYGTKEYVEKIVNDPRRVGKGFLQYPKMPISFENGGNIKENMQVAKEAIKLNLIKPGDILKIGKSNSETYSNYGIEDWSGYIILKNSGGTADFLTQEDYNRMMSM
jgi:hypothetical protein